MNRTTGAEATALSIAALTSVDSSLVCARLWEMRGKRAADVAPGRRAYRAPRNACESVSHLQAALRRRRSYGRSKTER